MNSFNNEIPLLKFLLTKDNIILVQITYLADEASFNPTEYTTLISSGFALLANNFHK